MKCLAFYKTIWSHCDDLNIYVFSVKNINKFDINKWHFLKIFGPIVAHSWQRDDDLGRKWHFVKTYNRKWQFLKIFGPIVAHSWQRDDDDLGRVGKRNSSLVEIQPNNV